MTCLGLLRAPQRPVPFAGRGLGRGQGCPARNGSAGRAESWFPSQTRTVPASELQLGVSRLDHLSVYQRLARIEGQPQRQREDVTMPVAEQGRLQRTPLFRRESARWWPATCRTCKPPIVSPHRRRRSGQTSQPNGSAGERAPSRGRPRSLAHAEPPCRCYGRPTSPATHVRVRDPAGLKSP
jgi:hypothetical protein